MVAVGVVSKGDDGCAGGGVDGSVSGAHVGGGLSD